MKSHNLRTMLRAGYRWEDLSRAFYNSNDNAMRDSIADLARTGKPTLMDRCAAGIRTRHTTAVLAATNGHMRYCARLLGRLHQRNTLRARKLWLYGEQS